MADILHYPSRRNSNTRYAGHGATDFNSLYGTTSLYLPVTGTSTYILRGEWRHMEWDSGNSDNMMLPAPWGGGWGTQVPKRPTPSEHRHHLRRHQLRPHYELGPSLNHTPTTTRVHPRVALSFAHAASLICSGNALSRPHGGTGAPSPLLRQNWLPPPCNCPTPPAPPGFHTMLEGEESSSFATAPCSCRLQSMSIAAELVAPWVTWGGRSAQWLALSVQLPRTRGHGLV